MVRLACVSGAARCRLWTVIGVRVGLGAAIAALLGAGLFFSGKLERDSRARVGDHASVAVTTEDVKTLEKQVKQAKAFDQTAFEAGVVEDATQAGLEGQVQAIAAAQRYALELEDAVVLTSGKTWTAEHVEIEATVDKVSYQKLGATVSARHSIAVVRNVSQVPIAYRVRVRSEERGSCEVRGARRHNAMALMPGDSAELVVCAGAGAIRIDRVEVLEISALGFHYLSRVPPRAAGQDDIAGLGHTPPRGTKMCETVDRSGLTRMLSDGSTRWVDITDFYSRHACDRFRFFSAYRYQPYAPARLPARPPK